MSTLDDRLRALDPFAGAPYEHADAAAMVERIAAVAPARRHRRRLAVLVAPMTAVAAAGLTAGLLVTAGTSAPSLTAIRITGGQHGTEAPVALGLEWAGLKSVALNQSLRAFTDTQYAPMASPALPASTAELYLVSAQLPTSTPAVVAYQAISPASPARVLATSASALRLDGAVHRLTDSAWQLGSGSSARGAITGLYRSPSGLYDFQYLRGDLAHPTRCVAGAAAGAVDTDRLAMSATVGNVLSALGLRYELAPATYRTTWARVGRAGCRGIAVLGETILVNGITTDQVVQAAFDPAGRLVAASLPVFMLGRTASYPLLSPAVAADALARSSASAAGRPTGPGHRASQAQAGGIFRDRYGVPVSLNIVEVRSSSIELRAFATTSGATWLVPVYALRGDGYTELAAGPAAWSGDVIATASPLVRVVGSAVNQSRVFDERQYRTLP
ncbi:MAG TPA: hypothetical protein VGZ03_02530 [Acidimicrobiales bacterium]|nr:hypothetical protein [Acidimicrobiales bacterium]